MASESKKRASPAAGLRVYLQTRHDPLTSLVLVVPVFLVYHLGILAIDVRNGVDLVSALTFALLEQSVGAYVAVTVGVAAAFVGAGYFLRKKGTIRAARLLPVLVESVLLAVLMTVLLGWATQKLFAGQVGPNALGVLDKIVLSAGAGFHEELVFRVGLFAGSAYVLSRAMFLTPWFGVAIAALLSSLAFSAVHYVGSMGDTFTLVSFTFRVLAGLYFCAIYRLRGFAVAVYTHTLYDLLVFFVY